MNAIPTMTLGTEGNTRLCCRDYSGGNKPTRLIYYLWPAFVPLDEREAAEWLARRYVAQDVPTPTAPRQQCCRPMLERITFIHEQLTADKFPNCTTVAVVFESSAKTIQRDIEFMRDRLGLPIDYNSKRFGYYYASETRQTFASWSDASVFSVSSRMAATQRLPQMAAP